MWLKFVNDEGQFVGTVYVKNGMVYATGQVAEIAGWGQMVMDPNTGEWIDPVGDGREWLNALRWQFHTPYLGGIPQEGEPPVDPLLWDCHSQRLVLASHYPK